MKTKLLKKLRKRFRWIPLKGGGHTLIDRKLKRQDHIYGSRFCWTDNDALMSRMMCRMKMGDKFVRCGARRDVRWAIRNNIITLKVKKP